MILAVVIQRARCIRRHSKHNVALRRSVVHQSIGDVCAVSAETLNSVDPEGMAGCANVENVGHPANQGEWLVLDSVNHIG